MTEIGTETLEGEVLKEAADGLTAECDEALGKNPDFAKALLKSYQVLTDLDWISIEFMTNGAKYQVTYRSLPSSEKKLRVWRYEEGNDDSPVEQLNINNQAQEAKIVYTPAVGNEPIRVDNQKAVDGARKLIASLKPAENNNPEKA